MSNSNRRVYPLIIALIDFGLLQAGFLLANWLQNGPSLETDSFQVISVAGLLFFYLFDLYNEWKRKSSRDLVYHVVIAMLAYHFLLYIFGIWGRGVPAMKDPASVLVAFGVHCVLLIVFRLLIWYIVRYFTGKKRVLILGKNKEESLVLADKFLNHAKGWFTVAGFLPVSQKGELQKQMDSVHAVMLGPGISKNDSDEIVSLCNENGKEVLVVPQMYEVLISTARTQQIDDMLVFSIRPQKITFVANALKRLFDVVVASVIFILTSPILLYFYFAIPLTSKGPAIYKQERVGQNGKVYEIYKFRSMRQDAEKLTGPMLAVNHDPRITKMGHLLRATRIDELPQIFNVFKGEMSIVGPRPERAFFTEQFAQQVPNYHRRMIVKPGITGLAQVMGNYTTTVDDKLRYDLLYVRNVSFTMDLKIVLQTLRVVLQREQAQGVKVADSHALDKLYNADED